MHEVLGLYDETTARYLISLAQESQSESALTDKLLKEDMLPDNVKSRDFISELHGKYRKIQEGPSDYQKQQQAKIE